jgi:anti-sigma-K factor RskA
MRDNRAEAGDDLDLLALLYANGEMDASQAAAFERRLGEDQRAREALVLAVELSRTLDGLPTPAPSPAYRDGVRNRLLPQGVVARLTRRRHRGHPVVWSAVGAAAAFLGVIVANGLLTTAPRQTVQAQVVPSAPAAAAAEQPNLHDTALIWSELPKHDHMNRLREEDQRRRSRPDDVRVARNEERPDRLTPEPMPSP